MKSRNLYGWLRKCLNFVVSNNFDSIKGCLKPKCLLQKCLNFMSVSFAIRCSPFAIRHSVLTPCSSHIRYSPFAVRHSRAHKKKIFNPFRYSLFAHWREEKKNSFFFQERIANRESRMANREWKIANDKACLKHKCLNFFHSPFPFQVKKIRKEGIFLSSLI